MTGSRATLQQPIPGLILGSSDQRSDTVLPADFSFAPSPTTPTFVADLRIDNHANLTRELGLPHTATDDEVLANAWARWEYGVVDHLIGGFAFAYWDAARRTLFLARDHVGERPLYFSRSAGAAGGFAFASTPPGLCAMPSTQPHINVGGTVRFLAAVSFNDTETFFEGIERLRPAHWMKVSPAGIEIHSYWHPIYARPIRYRRDSEYIDDFRERFDHAVAARLSGSEKLASYLSGGLDSASVTVTAARLLAMEDRRITSFTAVPQPGYDGTALFGRFGDEGSAAAEVAALYSNIEHLRIHTDGRDMIASLRRYARLTGQPDFNPTNMLWIDAILDAARQRGVSVMLQGTGGNATISFGGLIGLSRFFRRGHWIKLFRLTSGLRDHGYTSWRGAASWATGGLVPRSLRRLYHPVMRDFSLNYTAVHPQIAAEYRIRETALEEFFGTEHSTEAVRRNLYEYFDPGIENRFAEIGWQIEQRDPTLDKRIYEFCFGIPIEQYLVGAQTRSVVRRAMEGRLPESTLRRTTRGLQAADWYMTVRAALPQLSAELKRIEKSPLARHILDTSRLRTLIETFPASGYETTEVSEAWHHALTRGIAVGSFLAEHDPDVPPEEEDPATEKPGAVPGS